MADPQEEKLVRVLSGPIGHNTRNEGFLSTGMLAKKLGTTERVALKKLRWLEEVRGIKLDRQDVWVPGFSGRGFSVVGYRIAETKGGKK